MTDWFGSQKEAWETGYNEGCALSSARIAELEAELRQVMRERDLYSRSLSAIRDSVKDIINDADRIIDEARNPMEADREPPILEANNDRPSGADGPLSKRQLVVRRPVKTSEETNG